METTQTPRPLGGPAGLVSIAIPGVLFALFFQLIPQVEDGPILWSIDWVPSLDVRLGLNIDGLSLLFALLITGIGTLVALYSSAYLGAEKHYGRFVLFLMAFMVGMLGLVLSDNLLALFVFWEITTISSYLLIGYKADDPKSRRNALQALIVTGTGGLAFLAGIVLMGLAAGTFNISEMGDLTGHPMYLAIFVLVVLGAFTKSAQWPFHFWLPGAMAAPTPVSAYLHSATMVKGGVYLLARLSPQLGDTNLWVLVLGVFGGITAVFASIVAIKQTDMKQVLAWTTLMALGTLIMFIGIGTEGAIKGMVVFLLVHALYKAGLFLVAGLVDHGTGTRELGTLSGIGRPMPLTFAAALLAAISMAGIPPFFGFLGKEYLYKGALEGPMMPWVVGCAFAASALMFAVAFIVGWKPFRGERMEGDVHEGPWAMLLGPLILGALGLTFGILPHLSTHILEPAASAVNGAPMKVELHLYSGVNPALILSLVTFAVGGVLYWRHTALRARLARMRDSFNPGYDKVMDSVADGSAWLARSIQTGQLRAYIFVTFSALAVMMLATLLRAGAWPDVVLPTKEEIQLKHWSVLIFVLAGAAITTATNSRMTAIASLGAVGVGVALIFIIFGAPDVAITQLLVEVLQVVLVAVAMLKLPHLMTEQVRRIRGWDLALSLAIGAMVTLTLLHVDAQPLDLRITEFFEATSAPIAHGRNIVNVILVDFRALDTFGEIAVVVMAALGAYALLRGTRKGSP